MERELRDKTTSFYIYKRIDKTHTPKEYQDQITADDIAWYLGERVEG